MTTGQGTVINLETPITLDELLDRTTREVLLESARDLGFELHVIDRDRKAVIGNVLPESLCGPTDGETSFVDLDGRRFGRQELFADGDTIGILFVGPFATAIAADVAGRMVRHFVRLSDAFLHEGMRRAMAARMHVFTVEEAHNDMTEKNRRLNEAVERLQEADRLKSNFLATMSHELRTPLTSVIGYSEMLLEGLAGDLNPEQREYVQTVMEKGEHLLDLISGLLDISTMESNQMHFNKSSFDLGEVVKNCITTVTPVARRRRIVVQNRIVEKLPNVFGDKDKMRQVVLNLLGNAVKFTPEGGQVEVRGDAGSLVPSGVADETSPTGVRLAVRDNGIGIAPENHNKIFDPFFQVDNSSTREYGGTGLGLNIVRRYVEAHGGAVWVESQVGQGATFYFTLPLAPAG